MKMEEYVPNIIPTSNASDNPRKVSPPKTIKDPTTNAVEKLVSKVRLKVSVKLKLTTSINGLFLKRTKFSLILLKITIVSFME